MTNDKGMFDWQYENYLGLTNDEKFLYDNQCLFLNEKKAEVDAGFCSMHILNDLMDEIKVIENKINFDDNFYKTRSDKEVSYREIDLFVLTLLDNSKESKLKLAEKCIELHMPATTFIRYCMTKLNIMSSEEHKAEVRDIINKFWPSYYKTAN